MKFLGRHPDEDGNWDEAKIQMYIIQETRRMGYLITGSMEQGLRSKGAGGRAKAMGLSAGMPDMWVWGKWPISKNKTWPIGQNGVWPIGIELKTKTGIVSKIQMEMHDKMRELGYQISVVYAGTPYEGWEQVRGILCLRQEDTRWDG